MFVWIWLRECRGVHVKRPKMAEEREREREREELPYGFPQGDTCELSHLTTTPRSQPVQPRAEEMPAKP